MSAGSSPSPGWLDFDEYADGIADASVVLRDNAARTGLDADVPSCPGWTVRDLVVHLGVVHRWATATLLGDRLDTAAVEQEATAEVDLLGWLDDGVQDLLRTLDRSPDDLDAWFFLPDAPPPRLAWARRQCHETTMHAVDLMATSLGHPPTSRQLWFGPRRAADGIDELLTGFLPRRQTTFRPGSDEHVVAVVPSDSERRWTVTFTPATITASREGDDAIRATTLSGGAVDLYLTLWNRGGAGQDVEEEGEPFLEQWRTGMKVTWR
ncbi:MAG TPA: maleylpyruvate isomerase family mycothiol-dependent enzyme [Marmoricola sp.]|nr:maleylpyruvate isomerase family mycothiol-dependent enzyme [Marmoricola sp.]